MTAGGAGSATAWIIAISAVWIAIGVTTGFVANRFGLDFVGRDTWVTRLHRFEADGRFYERHLDIRRWKDRLPEAGATFRGGFSKRGVTDRSSTHLTRFAAETRRAEYVHWMNVAAGPAFLLVALTGLMPLWAGLLMVVFGLVVHLPFVCIQRYNRARLLRTLARRRTHTGVPPAPAVTPAAG